MRKGTKEVMCGKVEKRFYQILRYHLKYVMPTSTSWWKLMKVKASTDETAATLKAGNKILKRLGADSIC